MTVVLTSFSDTQKASGRPTLSLRSHNHGRVRDQSAPAVAELIEAMGKTSLKNVYVLL